ncbi:hypothetical protein RCO48_21365 [Peribacillus frigoritolerans]|nr:hypothetical protein [Peribacillus frigoritolerans]
MDLGTVEERYVDAMIEAIETNGPYVVITPGVAISPCTSGAGGSGLYP